MRENVQKWLSPPDPWKNHNTVHDTRHRGTGTWLIQGDTYAKWKSSDTTSLLWIKGKRQFIVLICLSETDDYGLYSGRGKERRLVRSPPTNSRVCELILLRSSAVIEDILAMRGSGQASLGFFYCDFREDQKKDRRGLLSSLLVQLGEQSDAYSAILSDLYAAYGRGSQHASDEKLLGCLKDMLKLPGQATVHIIIDALDECPTTTGFPTPREKVLEVVEELVNLQTHNLRICVTSRPEDDIASILGPLAFRSVSLEGESGQVKDIAEYIESVVKTDRVMRRWKGTDKQLVIEVLSKKADGM